jgi:hypothetical protein
MTIEPDEHRSAMLLTDREWEDLAAVCFMWLKEHPQGVPLCRQIAQRVVDATPLWEALSDTLRQPEDGRIGPLTTDE